MQRRSQIGAMRVIALFAAAVTLCGALSGCRGSTESSAPPEPPIVSTYESAEDNSSAEGTHTEDISSAETENPHNAVSYEEANSVEAGSGEIGSAEAVSSEASTAETETRNDPPASEVTPPPASSTEPVKTTEIDISVPEPPLASTPAVTTTPATTAAPKPPPEIVIPDVKTVSSPGEKVFTAGGSVVDYSNAALGYISVKYGGSSDKVRLRIICGGVVYDYMLAGDSTVRYFPLSCGSGEYTIQLWEHAHDDLYSNPINETVSLTVSDEVSMFLYPNYYIDFNKKSDAVAKSAEVCAGAQGTIEKIAAIFVYITDNITYDKELSKTVQGGYVPDPDRTLKKKTGICFDYSALFAAMARAQGIPTRLVIGYASPDIYHAWNEVYTAETGWITPELFLKQSGYNLVDSTFYAGASNKAQIAEYISSKSNYSALYYY